MASFVGNGIKEGQSTSRPPFFDGENYGYWKARMSTYLQASDYEQWRVIMHGPYKITKRDEEGNVIPKPEPDWNREEVEKVQYNARALNSLHCALSMEEYNKISSCKTAKEIWDKLEVANEGTTQVKEDNINMLVHDYELFQMEPNESLTSMHSRFLTLTNALSALGKDYSNHDKIRKLLRVLPKKWRPKVTAIQEAKDLHKLSIDELIGSLKTHEKELAREEKLEAKTKTLALKAKEIEDSSEEEDDLALLSKNFMKFLAKKKKNGQGRFNKFSSSRKFNDKPSQPRVEVEEVKKCFHCHEPGHFKSNCPARRKERKDKMYKKVKHALKGTWSDSDNEDSDADSSDEETANLCLMAREDDEVTSNLSSFSEFDDDINVDDNDEHNDYDELYELFEELHTKFEVLSKKYAKLKMHNSTISSHCETLEKENIDLKSKINSFDNVIEIDDSHSHDLENQELKEKVVDLTNSLAKFTNGRDNLDKLLGVQRCVFDKAGLGYNQWDNQREYTSFFKKYTPHDPTSLCSYCGRNTHLVQNCYYKNEGIARGRLAWVPKGTIMFANPNGPNSFWVPKEKLLKVMV